MEKRKEVMEVALSESLRELMLRNLFEKITIKQICDKTGVIRATFYNHFEDKYDCLNWIVYHDLVEEVPTKAVHMEYQDALLRAFETIAENKAFYKVAFQVTGQNSFEDMLRTNLKIYVLHYLEVFRKEGYLEKYDNDLLAGYYAETLAYCIRIFVFDINGVKTPEEMKQMIMDLTHHSVSDFLKY